MSEPIHDILASCLDAVESGDATPGDCLARYPQHQDELAGLLAAAQHIETVARERPAAEFRSVARTRLLNQLPAHEPSSWLDQIRAWWGAEFTLRPLPALARNALTAALFIFLVFAGSIGVAKASESQLPGDRFYAIKTAVEDVRLAAAAGRDADVKLNLSFALRRVVEMQTLVEQDRPEHLQIAARRYEQHIKHATMDLTAVPAADRDRYTDLANLLISVLTTSSRTFALLLPQVSADFQPALDFAMATAEYNLKLVTTVYPPETMPVLASPTPGLSAGPGTMTATATPTQKTVEGIILPTAHPSGTPTVPLLVSVTPGALLTPTPTGTPLPTPTPTGTPAPTGTLVPTPTPTATNAASPTPVVATPTFTPLPTATHTPVQPPTNTPEPIPTKQTPPGQTDTPEPPGQTKTPKPTKTPKTN